MMIALIINLIINAISLVGYSYLAILQYIQTLGKKDAITPLRRLILAIFIIALVTIIPGMIYQGYRLTGEELTHLRNVVNITSAVNRIATLFLLIVFVHYRVKHNEEE